jgi:hypothetical protein
MRYEKRKGTKRVEGNIQLFQANARFQSRRKSNKEIGGNVQSQ